MVNYTKHQHISTSSSTTSTLGLVDGTDKIHTGIIKALELAAAGTAVLEYGASLFQQTAGSSRTQFGVSGAIKYMREGLVLSSTPTAVELTADPDTTNDRYDMIVIQSSDNNFAVRVGTAASVPRVADNLTAGDIPVALVKVSAGASSTKNATTREVQLFGFDKTSNSLSVGYSDSGVYTESMSISSTSDRTTFKNKVANADFRFILADNTADEKFEILSDDDSDGDEGDTTVFSVDGLGAGFVSGNFKVGGNVIQASDGGSTITMDTSDNVTVAGNVTVSGGTLFGPTDTDLLISSDGNLSFRLDEDADETSQLFQFQNHDTTIVAQITEGGELTTTGGIVDNSGSIGFNNGQDATLSVATTTSTTAGRDLTIAAGSTTTGANNIDGGDLILKSGGGDGTGTSIMSFHTKVSGSDTAAERMKINTTGDVELTGDITVGGGDIIGPTDGALTIKADTDLIFKIDSDNDGTESFQFQNGGGTEIASLSEAGLLQIDGDLDVDGTGNSSIAGNLLTAGYVSAAGLITTAQLAISGGGTETLDIHTAGKTISQTKSCHYLFSSGGGTSTVTLEAPIVGTLHYIKNISSVNVAIVRHGSLHIDDGSTAHSKITVAHQIDLGPNESILLKAEADSSPLNQGHYTFDLDTSGTSNAPIEQGLHSIWVPAEAISPRSNAGCADLATTAAATSGRPDIRSLAFDTSTDEHAQFTIAMPKMWNEGTITAQFYWTNASATSGTVAWGLQGISLSNDDAIDTAFGTAIVTTDTQTGTAKDVHISAASSAITIGGSPAAGDLTCFQVYRDVSADNLAEDALLLGIKIFYTINAANDA